MADGSIAALNEVRRLHDWWDRRTRHLSCPADEWTADQLLLDTLGLGIGQAVQLFAARPLGFEDFLRWILETAGPPDPIAVARYHAALDRVPPPSEVAARLAAIDAMPPVLDVDDLAHWEAHGYVILRGAIGAEEAAAAAAWLYEGENASPCDPASWYGPRTNGLMIQRFQHPTLEAARRSPRVHKAFAQLWGTSDLWMRIDRVSFNPPEGRSHTFHAPRLHWDTSLVRPIPFATQAILYLSDTSEDQGALELVPGFHHRIDAWLDALGDGNPRAADLGAEAIRIAAGAGDLIIWRHDLPHGASPNRAARPRLAQYLNMYPADLQNQAEWL